VNFFSSVNISLISLAIYLIYISILIIIIVYVDLYTNKILYFLGIGDWGLGPIPNPQSPLLYRYK